MSKRFLRFQLIFYAVVTLVASGIFIYFLLGNSWFDQTETNTMMTSFDQSYPSQSNLKSIEVDTVSEDVDFYYHDEKSVRVVYLKGEKADKKRPKVIATENSIRIQSEYNGKIFNFSFFNHEREAKLKIYIPKDYSGEIIMKSVSGDIKSELLKDITLQVHTTSGNIQLSGCDNCHVTVKSISGYIKIMEGSYKLLGKTTSEKIEVQGLIEHFDLSSVSGSLDVVSNLMITENSRAKTTSGDIIITIPENDGFEANYSSVSGEFKNGLTGEKGQKKGTSIYKSAKIMFDLKTVSGKMHIN